MPVLRDTSKIEKVYLPSYQNDAEGNLLSEDQWAWVMFDCGPNTVGDSLGIDAKDADGKIGALTIVNRIKDWNMTDSTGAPLEVTLENVAKLVGEDYQTLTAKLPTKDTGGLSEDEKKPLNDTSKQSIAVQIQE